MTPEMAARGLTWLDAQDQVHGLLQKALHGKLFEQAKLQRCILVGPLAERRPSLGRPAFSASRVGCFPPEPLEPPPTAGSRAAPQKRQLRHEAAAVAEHDPAGGAVARCPLCSAGLSLELELPSPLFACPGCDQHAALRLGVVETRCRAHGSLASVAPQQQRLQVQLLQIW